VQVSGGLRYGRLEYSNETPTLFGVGTATFEGVGPTFALNGRRAISNTGFSFFGNVRGSVLMGDIRNSALLPFMPAVTLEDEVMTVAENQTLREMKCACNSSDYPMRANLARWSA
jgi:hypothetical protein